MSRRAKRAVAAASARLRADTVTHPRVSDGAESVEATHAVDHPAVCNAVADLLESGDVASDQAAVVAATLGWRVGFIRGLQARGSDDGIEH
jgi:hypothetical protein